MSDTLVYLFSGKFENRIEACSYSEPQWNPEPEGTVTDEEYNAWEESNPTHKLKENINSYLDEDFIETVELDMKYLSSINISNENIKEITTLVNDSNFLVLVYKEALGGFELASQPASNSSLTYCGQYKCTF